MVRHAEGTGSHAARRYLPVFGSVVAWTLIAVLAWFTWPSSLGGGTTYVIVSGHSMEPTFHDGDLVVIRQGDVEVGDVVLYSPAELGGGRIVHRIVGGNAEDGWIIQGDNNDLPDLWNPTGDEILGKQVLFIPHLGMLGKVLLSPLLWGAVLLAAVLFLLWPDRHKNDNEVSADVDLSVGERVG